MQNKKSVIRFRVTYQKISDNVPYSYLCMGNGMSESGGVWVVNLFQMVLVSWPDSGLQSISTKPQVSWVAKSGIRLHSGCELSLCYIKPSGFGVFLTSLYLHCLQTTSFWLILYL